MRTSRKGILNEFEIAIKMAPRTGRSTKHTEIGKRFVQLYHEKSLDLAAKMLEHFGEEGTILEGFYPQAQEVLNGITRQYPQQVWELVTKYLRPQIDSRAFYIKRMATWW